MTYRCSHNDELTDGCELRCNCGHRCDQHPVDFCTKCNCHKFENFHIKIWLPIQFGEALTNLCSNEWAKYPTKNLSIRRPPKVTCARCFEVVAMVNFIDQDPHKPQGL